MRSWVLFTLIVTLGLPAGAEDGFSTIRLKGDAAVTGTILARKKDQIVVDLGYTVLSIPSGQIAEITDTQTNVVLAAAPVAPVTEKVEPGQSFYRHRSAASEDWSVRDLVNEIGEAVVQVRTPGGMGSGFILNEEGFLITNFHVIEGDTQISIEVYHQQDGQFERRTYKQIRIIAINKFQDLALLRIEDKDAPKFKSVPLGESDLLAVGDSVFAVGSPMGLERTVTEGIVSTKTRQVQGDLYLQTTTQINPGNSGGPLFNLRGEVVGVTNMKLAFGEGLGFAIPIEAVRFFLKHREAYAYEHENPNNPYHYLEPPSRLKQIQNPPDQASQNNRNAQSR